VDHRTGVLEGFVHLALFGAGGLLVVLVAFALIERMAGGDGRRIVGPRLVLAVAGLVVLFAVVEGAGHLRGW
jgi:hypothetical protein